MRRRRLRSGSSSRAGPRHPRRLPITGGREASVGEMGDFGREQGAEARSADQPADSRQHICNGRRSGAQATSDATDPQPRVLFNPWLAEAEEPPCCECVGENPSGRLPSDVTPILPAKVQHAARGRFSSSPPMKAARVRRPRSREDDRRPGPSRRHSSGGIRCNPALSKSESKLRIAAPPSPAMD